MGSYFNSETIERNSSTSQGHVKSGAVSVASITDRAIRIVSDRTIKVYMWAGTAATGTGGLTCQVLKNGVLAATVTLGITAANTPVAGDTSFAVSAGDMLTFNVTSVGGTVAGSDLQYQIVGA